MEKCVGISLSRTQLFHPCILPLEKNRGAISWKSEYLCVWNELTTSFSFTSALFWLKTPMGLTFVLFFRDCSVHFITTFYTFKSTVPYNIWWLLLVNWIFCLLSMTAIDCNKDFHRSLKVMCDNPIYHRFLWSSLFFICGFIFASKVTAKTLLTHEDCHHYLSFVSATFCYLRVLAIEHWKKIVKLYACLS